MRKRKKSSFSFSYIYFKQYLNYNGPQNLRIQELTYNYYATITARLLATIDEFKSLWFPSLRDFKIRLARTFPKYCEYLLSILLFPGCMEKLLRLVSESTRC